MARQQGEGLDPGSDDVLEAVGGVAGQPRPLAAATQVLAVGAGHVAAPGLHVPAPRRRQASLDQDTMAPWGETRRNT